MSVTLRCGSQTLVLDRPRVMGILNVTPDSFSDGGRFVSVDKALAHAEVMVAAGADIIDIGGESTRPGADAVTEQQELDRVIPVIEAIGRALDTVVSIDSSKAAVISAAAKAGAGIINDVRALQEPGAADTALQTGLPVCLMHMKGAPTNMQDAPEYDDVVAEVVDFLQRRTAEMVAKGIKQSQILWDPGFGFGKTAEHNLVLLKNLQRLSDRAPVLIGLSRKRLLGEILQDAAADRTNASVIAALLAAQKGASILRVHDVRQTVEAVKVWQAMNSGCITE